MAYGIDVQLHKNICLVSLGAKRILGHPLWKELEWITAVVVEVVVSTLDTCFLEYSLQFILFPHHTRISGATDKLSVDKELWESFAPGDFLQGRSILVAHVSFCILKRTTYPSLSAKRRRGEIEFNGFQERRHQMMVGFHLLNVNPLEFHSNGIQQS